VVLTPVSPHEDYLDIKTRVGKRLGFAPHYVLVDVTLAHDAHPAPLVRT
jgi:hypothetical protein